MLCLGPACRAALFALTAALLSAPAMAKVPEVLRGVATDTVIVETASDLRRLKRVSVIDGDLRIEGAGLSTVEIPYVHTIHGRLIIRDTSGATNIRLPQLLTVGTITIEGTTELVELGLPKLHTLALPVRIRKNARLERIELPNLVAVDMQQGDAWELRENAAIQELLLPKLTHAAIAFDLRANAQMRTFALPSAEGSLGSLVVTDMPLLEHVQLGRIETIRELAFTRLPLLEHIEAPRLARVSSTTLTELESLRQLDLPSLALPGDLLVAGNPALVSVRLGATTLGNVEFRHNPLLESVQLDLASRIESLLLADSPALQTLVLPSLRTVQGDLRVSDCEGLTSLDLGIISIVGGDLHLQRANALTRIIAPALRTVAGRLHIEHLPALTLLDMNYLGANHGGVLLVGNGALAQVSLPRLQWSGTFEVRDHAALKRLDLSELSVVDGDLTIVGNGALDALDIPALAEVRGAIEVQGSPPLQQSNLPKLTAVFGSFTWLGSGEVDVPRLKKVGAGMHVPPTMGIAGCSVLALLEPLRRGGWTGAALLDPRDVPCRTGKRPDKALRSDLKRAGVKVVSAN